MTAVIITVMIMTVEMSKSRKTITRALRIIRSKQIKYLQLQKRKRNLSRKNRINGDP